MRVAHRNAIVPDLSRIADGVHQVTASSTVLRTRIGENKDPKGWYEKAAAGRQIIEAVRPRVKYSLYGLTDPLRTLSRMPDWVAHTANADGQLADTLIDDMQKLQRAIDSAIRRSYRRGLPPSPIRRWWLDRKSSNAKATYQKFLASPIAETAEEPPTTGL